MKEQFINEGYINLNKITKEKCVEALKKIKQNRNFNSDLFLSESDFKKQTVRWGTNPKPGRNLTESIELESIVDDIRNELAQILGDDFEILFPKVICGVPKNWLTKYVLDDIFMTPIPNLGVFIKPEYLQFKKSSLRNSIDQILIFMGGADSKNVTSKVIEALSENEFKSIHLDIIIGSNNSNKLEIEGIANERGNFTLYFDRPHLADLMNTADLSIGAAGNTAWERVCVGLPSFIITLADNQVPIANYLNKLGFVSYIGHHDLVTTKLIQNSIRGEIKDRQLRNNFIVNKTICDGMGVSRVAKRIFLLIQ
jgi:UDP-N-acetylglucosamine:LPS N-acetylglucosamine transferase